MINKSPSIRVFLSVLCIPLFPFFSIFSSVDGVFKRTNNPAPNYPQSISKSIYPIFENMDPKVVGVKEHGAMVCINSDISDQLEKVELSADIGQEGKFLDQNVKAQYMDDMGNCFEVMDAKYHLGVPVSVKIRANDIKNENVEEQDYEIGKYGLLNPKGNLDHYPFLSYIFPIEINSMYLVKIFIPGRSDQGYHPALDFSPDTNSSYPVLQDIPVLSPVKGKVMQVGMDDPNQPGEQRVNNIIIESEYTGWLVTLGHLSNRIPSGELLNSYCDADKFKNLTWRDCTTTFSTGQHFSFMFLYKASRGGTHIHLGVTDPAGDGIYTEGDLNNIDPTYLWLSPPDVPELLKNAKTILTKKM